MVAPYSFSLSTPITVGCKENPTLSQCRKGVSEHRTPSQYRAWRSARVEGGYAATRACWYQRCSAGTNLVVELEKGAQNAVL
eukprot:3439867-Rhodomonas_salina.2